MTARTKDPLKEWSHQDLLAEATNMLWDGLLREGSAGLRNQLVLVFGLHDAWKRVHKIK